MAYQEEGTPLICIGGEDYGMGSSRDWVAPPQRLVRGRPEKANS